MKVYLAFCSYQDVTKGTVFCALRTLLAHPSTFGWGMGGSDALVSRARSVDATGFLLDPNLGDVMLYLDHDIEFEPQDALRVAQLAYDHQCIAGAAYVTRSDLAPHPALRLFPGQKVALGKPNPPVEVVYLSTGFLAFHREVLKKLASTLPWVSVGSYSHCYPFFLPFIYEGEYLSEDWAFCQRARDLGIQVVLDPTIKLAHMGSRAYILEDLAMDAFLSTVNMTVTEGSLDRTDIIGDLADYLGKSKMEIIQEFRANQEWYYRKNLAESWNRKAPVTEEQVLSFYKESGQDYLRELVIFNLSPLYWVKAGPLVGTTGKKLVDFGGGIGTLSIVLAKRGRNVTFIELPSEHRKFAEFRFKRHNLEISVANSLAEVQEVDAILCGDVIEHIHPDSLPGLVGQMYEALNHGGRVVEVSDFGKRPEVPMHYSTANLFSKLMKEKGFIKEVSSWRKN